MNALLSIPQFGLPTILVIISRGGRPSPAADPTVVSAIASSGGISLNSSAMVKVFDEIVWLGFQGKK